MDRCTTCRKDYNFALDWGICPSCKEMFAKGYKPIYTGGRKVWRHQSKIDRLAAQA